ncbi:MAG: TetR/AcrR family transcriptional regulator [Xanthobacteraceae bacterium]|nr:TetR/AcrR family transcriptional regulator [Xanthobacteraceae bacterium]
MDTRTPASEHSPWLPFESRRRARDEKREAVLRAAVQLFLERGYHRATLNEVADRLNITKPALYNYFRSKEDILFECWSIGQERVEDQIAGIEAAGENGLATLRRLVRTYAATMASDFGASLVRFNVADLSEANQKATFAGKRRIDRAFRDAITQGIADKSIRPCDVKLTAFAILGALNWIGHWYKPGGELSPDQIADDFAIRLTADIAKSSAKPSANTKSKTKPSKPKAARAIRDI